MKNIVKGLSIILCLTLCFPITVFAEETTKEGFSVPDTLYQTEDKKVANGKKDNISTEDLNNALNNLNSNNSNLSLFDTIKSNFQDFNSNNMFDMDIPNNENTLGTINFQYSLLKESLKTSGMTFDFEEKEGYSLNALNLFNSTYGNLYEENKLEAAVIPEDFNPQEMMSKGKKERDKAFNEIFDTDEYKTVHSLINSSNILNQAQQPLKTPDLVNSNTLKSMLDTSSSSIKSDFEKTKQNMNSVWKSDTIGVKTEADEYGKLNSAANKELFDAKSKENQSKYFDQTVTSIANTESFQNFVKNSNISFTDDSVIGQIMKDTIDVSSDGKTLKPDGNDKPHVVENYSSNPDLIVQYKGNTLTTFAKSLTDVAKRSNYVLLCEISKDGNVKVIESAKCGTFDSTGVASFDMSKHGSGTYTLVYSANEELSGKVLQSDVFNIKPKSK